MKVQGFPTKLGRAVESLPRTVPTQGCQLSTNAPQEPAIQEGALGSGSPTPTTPTTQVLPLTSPPQPRLHPASSAEAPPSPPRPHLPA